MTEDLTGGPEAERQRREAVQAGETREQYKERLRDELRGGPERLKKQLRLSDERTRPEHGDGTRERRNTVEQQQRPSDAPVDHPRAEKSCREAEGHGDHVWVDRGVVDTKLSRIDSKEYAGVWEEQKTHKYSKEEIDASLKGLHDLRSRFGDGTSREELRALVSSSDPKERQIGRTYMSYYESDPIKVDFTADGRSTVTNGRHRLARADHLGMDEIPIRVNEQARRRNEGER
jgi:hypothetical protein